VHEAKPIGRTLVVLPTFSERPNLEGIVTCTRAQGCDVVIVDDNSPDGTGELADLIAARDPGVHVIHRAAKLGLGTAYLAGFRFGLDRDYQFLVGMDADGSHHTRHLVTLVEAARVSGGLSIGSRYVSGGSIVGWSWRRMLLSSAANVYCRRVLGIHVRDCTSGYRCYPRQLVQQIDLDDVISDGYGFLIEMLYICLQLGYPVTEVPIRFEDRVAGKSKVSEREIFKAMTLVPRLRSTRPQAIALPAEPPHIEVLGVAGRSIPSGERDVSGRSARGH
jgi:glycosyltransferase involved in cell wall biosynthesis